MSIHRLCSSLNWWVLQCQLALFPWLTQASLRGQTVLHAKVSYVQWSSPGMPSWSWHK